MVREREVRKSPGNRLLSVLLTRPPGRHVWQNQHQEADVRGRPILFLLARGRDLSADTARGFVTTRNEQWFERPGARRIGRRLKSLFARLAPKSFTCT